MESEETGLEALVRANHLGVLDRDLRFVIDVIVDAIPGMRWTVWLFGIRNAELLADDPTETLVHVTNAVPAQRLSAGQAGD